MSDDNSRESDLLKQRRENFKELVKLGVDPYPRQFERTHTVDELVTAYGGRTHDELEAEQIRTRTAGRIMAIRSFGKANFLAISDGRTRTQIYIRKDSLPERDFSIFRLLDFGDTDMSCSISRTEIGMLVADEHFSSSLSSALLARVEAGRRFVEAEQHRVGAHGARDLEPALLAIGQVAGEIVGARADRSRSSQ